MSVSGSVSLLVTVISSSSEVSADVEMKSLGDCVSESENDCINESGVRMTCDSCGDVEMTVVLCVSGVDCVGVSMFDVGVVATVFVIGVCGNEI